MISALYIVLGALFLIKFSFDVMKLRRQYRIAYGDGGFYELQKAIRIHSSAIESVPLSSLLLIMMEMNGADIWMLHLSAFLFYTGQVMHYYGTRHSLPTWYHHGFSLTVVALIFMVILNLFFMPWDLLFNFYYLH